MSYKVKQENNRPFFFIGSILCLLIFVANIQRIAAQQLTDYVDPFIGSGGHGHVFVGANVPFGGVQLGPDNFYKGWDWCSGYNYRDSVIRGFSHTHLSGTGIGDLSDILLMPYTGEIRLDKGDEKIIGSGYSSKFYHENEHAKPGYYQVKLENGVKVALTATERVGFHAYTFPLDQSGRVIIDLNEGINDRTTEAVIEQVNDTTFIGWRASSGWAKKQCVYFALITSIPVKDAGIYKDNKLLSSKKGTGTNLKGVLSFGPTSKEIKIKVGISPVSSENAQVNISKEIPDWNFQQVRLESAAKWEKELAKIAIKTKSDTERKIFYTAMYHAMMHPSLFNDYNRDYRGADGKVYKDASFNNYSIFSTWDTYRAEHPLFTIINHERVDDMVNSMLAIADQQGHLPIWHLTGYETGTMVGISSQQIVAEAFLKGFNKFDEKKAYTALKNTSNGDFRGLAYVQKFKPIPNDIGVGRSVANGLELAVSDASIALMAKKLGRLDDYEYYQKRSKNYRLYYDTVSGFFRGIQKNGKWNPSFNPIKSTRPWAADYAEGNAWQYLWLAPHDVAGLTDLLGGKKLFLSKLDEFFSLPIEKDEEGLVDLTGNIGQYAHGNEPSHHIAYLYSLVGNQWKAAEKVRHIVTTMYHEKKDGLIGNEDCGQMSAWYLFSSLGFYPVFPASGRYVFGSPSLEEASIKLEGGKTFHVKAINNAAENLYIQEIKLNGKKYTKPYLTHEDLTRGGTLEFSMGPAPNTHYFETSY